MLTNTITIRQGSTFSYAALLALPIGVTWSISATLKDKSGVLLQMLTCTIQELATPTANHETHSILLEANSTQTALWEPNTYEGHITFIDDSTVPRSLVSGAFFVAVQGV